eukprot:155835-Rhodomonas_salina.3
MPSSSSKSASMSLQNTGPYWIMSCSRFEISDLPPPETVAGLCRLAPSATVPLRCHFSYGPDLVAFAAPTSLPELLRVQPQDVRRQNDAPCHARPMLGVERCVVLCKVGVVGIAKDRLDKVEVAHARARHEETHL